MVKDIVVNLSGRESQAFAADYALSIAKMMGAHVTGIAFVFEPIIPDTPFGGGIPVDLIEIQREENAKAANAAISHFETAAKGAGVSAETRTLEATFGSAATEFARIARRADIAVLGQARRETGPAEELMIEGALFDSGRPVIVVPFIQKQGLKLDRVLACWDGGRTAARAIGDAMPFLERAGSVELVIVAEHGKNDDITGASMAGHLSRHGIAVEVKRVSKGDIDVRDAILSYVADRDADLIVMGGYGHSRLREFILGGVTRGILASMTVPVLMSH
jgi:nucleotide-binding universal stress UspA family protein